MSDKFIRIYDRNHNLLDELYNFDGLKYGWTLNAIDTLECQIALNDPKCTEKNVHFANHFEIIDSSDNIIWGGLIFGHNFDDTVVKLNCLDYNALLSRRLRVKQYPAMQYGALMRKMIADCQAARTDYPMVVTIGSIADGALQTTREVKNTDLLWQKIKEFGDDANYDYGVDLNRAFNFWIRRGSDKLQYILEWGGDADNITVKPTLARDVMSLANCVYSESSVSGSDGNSTLLTSIAEDKDSQQEYGLFDGIFSPNTGVSIQSTLDTQTHGELQRCSQPADSITLSIRDSCMCPFNDIGVGDRVTLHLIPYFNYTASVRILRMVHDEKSNIREITVGSIIFKPQGPTKKLYRR